jgi:hypothetical protein
MTRASYSHPAQHLQLELELLALWLLGLPLQGA